MERKGQWNGSKQRADQEGEELLDHRTVAFKSGSEVRYNIHVAMVKV